MNCPKCNSDYVNLLAIGEFNQNTHGCQSCYWQWTPEDEVSIPRCVNLLNGCKNTPITHSGKFFFDDNWICDECEIKYQEWADKQG